MAFAAIANISASLMLEHEKAKLSVVALMIAMTLGCAKENKSPFIFIAGALIWDDKSTKKY
jgi:hypothetical protein